MEEQFIVKKPPDTLVKKGASMGSQGSGKIPAASKYRPSSTNNGTNKGLVGPGTAA